MKTHFRHLHLAAQTMSGIGGLKTHCFDGVLGVVRFGANAGGCGFKGIMILGVHW